jgi:NADH-quinone oxidoreductase subunit N
MKFDLSEIAALAPVLILTVGGCAALLGETLVKRTSRSWLAVLALIASLAALAAAIGQWGVTGAPRSIFSGMWVLDRMSLVLDAIFATTAAMTVLSADAFMREHDFDHGELHALVLFAAAGMMMVGHATHLLSLLIGIETMSLAAYILVASWRRQVRGAEGALKYLLLGAFATGFLVYGTALLYGTSGGMLDYAGLAARVPQAAGQPLFMLGVYFVLAGVLFKVAAVPFHTWAPDAYEGAPTPVTGFMAAGVKAAALGALVRLCGSVFSDAAVAGGHAGWVRVLGWIAIATMTLGNLAAIRQENVKRMLAYSSIAHAGYLLVGVAALGLGLEGARSALIFYLAAYAMTTLGIFAGVAWMGRRQDERLQVSDWSGLSSTRPALALAMSVFLLSLAGVPPTGGFFAKFYLFRSAMQSPELYPLVIIAVLNSVVSVYYYLRLVVAMYFKDPLRPWDLFSSKGLATVVVVAVLVVMMLGLVPGPLVDLVADASTLGR